MPAYIHANLEITDPVAFDEYRRKVPAIISAYGGRYLVAGGATEVLEGDISPRIQVIIEFPGMAELHGFYHSTEYQPLKVLRQRTSRGSSIAIAGL